MRHTEKRENFKTFFENFEELFSQFLVLEVFCKENKFPES